MADRNVFVFFDGTNCQLSTNSNVVRFREIVTEEAEEHPYMPGPGSDHSWWLARIMNTLGGYDLDDVARRAYSEIARMKLTRFDRLFVIGYSRGAITARTFVQMVTVQSVRENLFAKSNFESVISAKVQFVGLFDPVIGWPFFFKRKSRERQLAKNKFVHGYVEIIAMDEQFLLFPSHSFVDLIASNNNRYTSQGVAMPTPELSAVGEVERKRLGRRAFIWMPGEHRDIGGQGGDQVISDHALLTMLEQMLVMSNSAEQRIYFNAQKAEQHLNSVGMDDEVKIGKIGPRRLLCWRSRKPQVDDVSVVHEFAKKIDGRPGVFNRYFLSKRKRYRMDPVFAKLPVEPGTYPTVQSATQ